VVLVALWLSPATAAAAGRDPAKEASYAADIPARAEVFRQATAAMDAGRWEEANRGFLEVVATYPQHGPSLWRLSRTRGGPYDSHPPPAKRIAWAARVPASPDQASTDDGPAWELFADRAALEAEMTRVANQRLRERAVITGSID
jgi:hypothetical protein